MTAPMSFYRRPALAGRNISRLSVGTIRGDVRRHDPDGTSAVPYFPSLVAGMTLLVTVDGTPYTITFSNDSSGAASGLQNVLNNINAVLTTHGLAFDSGGTVSISTLTTGASGSVQVTGGTGAVILGYDVTGKTIRSTGGDVLSAGEGGIGNWFGVEFPNVGDNVTSSLITRALARVAGNTDVLYSDVSRNDALMQKIGNVTGTAITGQAQYGYCTPPSATEIFTGFGFLSNASVKEDLAAYFQLIDTATKQQAMSRVVGVVRGTPTGAPPYTNTASYGALDGGNILGLDLIKATQAITGIFDGELVYCSGATFTSTATVGDTAEITAATNLNTWSNNGYKWVVSAVIDDQHLHLRPMSMAELALYSTVPSEEQPVLELNDTISVGQSYGSLNIHTGTYANGVNLVVSPPIPSGATYELWAASPSSLRFGSPSVRQASAGPLARSLVSSLTPIQDAVLSGGTMSAQVGTGNLQIAAALVRWHGTVYNLPQQIIAKTSVANGSYFVYFNSTTGIWALSSNASDVFGPSALGPYLGYTTKGTSFFTINSSGEYPAPLATANGILTVGAQGDFQTLQAALHYAGIQSTGSGEAGSSSGAYSHAEIWILETQNVSSSLNVTSFDTKIRSVSPSAVINFSGTDWFIGMDATAGNLTLENLTIAMSNSVSLVQGNTSGGSGNVILNNVTVTTTPVGAIVMGSASPTFGAVVMDRCNIPCSQSLIQGTPSSVYIDRSTFATTYTIQQQLFSPATGPGLWLGGSIDMRRSIVTGLGTNTIPGCLSETASNSNRHRFSDCYFDNSGGNTAASSFISTVDEVQVTSCTFTSSFLSVINSPHQNSRFEKNHVDGLFAQSTPFLVQCTASNYNIISAAEGTTTAGTVIQAGEANWNRITGVATIGIDLVLKLHTAESSIRGVGKALNNLVDLVPGIHTVTTTSIRNRLAGSRVTGNAVFLVGTFTANTGILLDNGTTGTPLTSQLSIDATVDGNLIIVDNGGLAISTSSNSSNCTIERNVLRTLSSATTGLLLIGGSTASHNVVGNVFIQGGVDASTVSLSISGAGECIIADNLFSVSSTTASCVTVSSATGNRYENNILLLGSVGSSGAPITDDFINNRVTGAAFFTTASTQTIDGNRIAGAVTSSITSSSAIQFFNGNYLGGTLTTTGTGVFDASGTTVAGVASVSAAVLHIVGNNFQNILALSGATVGDLTLVGNRIGSQLSLLGVTGVVTGNTISSGTNAIVVDENGANLTSDLIITGNKCIGSVGVTFPTVTPSAVTGTGSLTTGTYGYIVAYVGTIGTAMTLSASATLGATGHINLTFSAFPSYVGTPVEIQLYRASPTDSGTLHLLQVFGGAALTLTPSTTAFTDNGPQTGGTQESGTVLPVSAINDFPVITINNSKRVMVQNNNLAKSSVNLDNADTTYIFTNTNAKATVIGHNFLITPVGVTMSPVNIDASSGTGQDATFYLATPTTTPGGDLAYQA